MIGLWLTMIGCHVRHAFSMVTVVCVWVGIIRSMCVSSECFDRAHVSIISILFTGECMIWAVCVCAGLMFAQLDPRLVPRLLTCDPAVVLTSSPWLSHLTWWPGPLVVYHLPHQPRLLWWFPCQQACITHPAVYQAWRQSLQSPLEAGVTLYQCSRRKHTSVCQL